MNAKLKKLAKIGWITLVALIALSTVIGLLWPLF